MTIDSLSALYFPATRLSMATAARLLLPLAKLYSYRPVEGPPAMAQPLAAAGLVEAYPSAPLGNELDRFRRQLNDMQAHAAEYYQAYLSSLAAGMEEDPEAGWRQVARRLKQTAPAREEREDSLWRARLYLALAENHTALQEDLVAGIQAAACREAELLRQLQGEDEELAELRLLPAATTVVAPIQAKQQLTAWGLLYLADPRPDRPWLLATADEESAGLLFEEYERAAGRSPEKLLALALPPLAIHSEEGFFENRQALRTAAHHLLPRLGDFLTAAASTEPADSVQAAMELAAAWQQLLPAYADALTPKPSAEGDASEPASAAVLTFYRLPGISFPRLFRLFCRQEGQKAAGSSSPNGILAVISDAVGGSVNRGR